ERAPPLLVSLSVSVAALSLSVTPPLVVLVAAKLVTLLAGLPRAVPVAEAVVRAPPARVPVWLMAGPAARATARGVGWAGGGGAMERVGAVVGWLGVRVGTLALRVTPPLVVLTELKPATLLAALPRAVPVAEVVVRAPAVRVPVSLMAVPAARLMAAAPLLTAPATAMAPVLVTDRVPTLLVSLSVSVVTLSLRVRPPLVVLAAAKRVTLLAGLPRAVPVAEVVVRAPPVRLPLSVIAVPAVRPMAAVPALTAPATAMAPVLVTDRAPPLVMALSVRVAA